MTGPGWRRRITRHRSRPRPVTEPAPAVRVLPTPRPAPAPARTTARTTAVDDPCPDCTPTRPCDICRALGVRSTR